MYKRIVCALCIVIALFFLIPLIYFLWTREPSPEKVVLQGPHIEVFLKYDHKRPNTSVLLHSTPNSELIISTNILTEPLPGDSGGLSSSARQGSNLYKRSLRLECHAKAPVKWEYHGDGGLVTEAKHHNKREVKDFHDPSTYYFETVLEFFNVTEGITGKYICKFVDDPESKKYVYIYGKGEKVFVSKKDREREIEVDQKITIPCPVSDPTRNISLRNVVPAPDKIFTSEVPPSIISSYNPQVGFTLFPNNWDSYICLDEDTRQISGIVRIYKPKRFTVKGEFMTVSSTNVAQNHTSLKVLCEAKEDVTLNFINVAKFKRRQVHFYNETSDFPFTARIKMRTEYFKNHSRVECVTTNDSRVLRVWRFISDDWSDRTFMRFDNQSKGYECCTHTREIPRLTQATCYTPVECEMKRSCVKLDKSKCPYYEVIDQPIYEGQPGCTLAKVERHPSGILECSYGGRTNSTKSYMYYYNEKRNFQNYTSTDFKKRNPNPQDILRVEQRHTQFKSIGSSSSSSNNNDPVIFDCYGAKFFLESGFQWAVKKWGSPLQFVINQGIADEDSVSELHEWISIPQQNLTTGSISIACIAPVLNSPDKWVNVTRQYKRVT